MPVCTCADINMCVGMPLMHVCVCVFECVHVCICVCVCGVRVCVCVCQGELLYERERKVSRLLPV